MPIRGIIPGTAVALTLLMGCAPAPMHSPIPGAGDPVSISPPGGGHALEREEEGRAARSGTLHQDQFTVQLRAGPVQVKVTPLAEEVIRLAAPDTYRRLGALTEGRSAEIRALAGSGPHRLFLVSFFTLEPNTPFHPQALEIRQQGRVHRPLTIVAITPGWGAERLPRQELRSAIYAFDATLDLSIPFSVSYDRHESDDWSRILPRLQFERGRLGGV